MTADTSTPLTDPTALPGQQGATSDAPELSGTQNSAPQPDFAAPTSYGAPAYAAAPRQVSTTANGMSIAALVLSISSIVVGQGVFAVLGIVFGFIARGQEPAHRTLSNWGIVIGFVSLFAWVVFAIIGIAVFAPLALFGLAAGN